MTSRSMPALACPKCREPMMTVERSGVHLEICPECKGLFLDRGELDRLLDAEARDLGAMTHDPVRRPPARYRHEDDDDDDRRGRRGERRGFLGELFEGLMD